jgi:BirA family biotin operon repressor/biotin-[acetyl-CoA-carboxylase] ligase
VSAVEFGRPRRHFRLCDSTNERARELALAGAPAGSIVTATEQSAGRGRHGRRWAGPAGRALLCSAILSPLDEGHRLLPLAVPLAVCEAIESLAPVACGVKWPNDVWIEERKVAGVLIEAKPPDWAVIGVGVNVAVAPQDFPDQLRWPATSVGHGVTVEALLDALCGRLSGWVAAPLDRVLPAFRERDALKGRRIGWEDGGDPDAGAGVADGIDEDGNLLVATDSGGRLALGAGDVHLSLG